MAKKRGFRRKKSELSTCKHKGKAAPKAKAYIEDVMIDGERRQSEARHLSPLSQFLVVALSALFCFVVLAVLAFILVLLQQRGGVTQLGHKLVYGVVAATVGSIGAIMSFVVKALLR